MSVGAAPRPTKPGLTLFAVCAAIVLVPVTATGASIALPDISGSLSTSLAHDARR